MQYVLAVLLLATMFLAGVWDVWVTYHERPDETVSNILQGWSVLYPVLPLLVGILLGHIFWPRIPGVIRRGP